MVETQTTRGQESDYIWGRGQSEIDRLLETGRHCVPVVCPTPVRRAGDGGETDADNKFSGRSA